MSLDSTCYIDGTPSSAVCGACRNRICDFHVRREGRGVRCYICVQTNAIASDKNNQKKKPGIWSKIAQIAFLLYILIPGI